MDESYIRHHNDFDILRVNVDHIQKTPEECRTYSVSFPIMHTLLIPDNNEYDIREIITWQELQTIIVVRTR